MASKILQNAAEVYERQRKGEIKVPEWLDENGKPTVIYFNRASLKDRSKYFKKHSANNLEYLVDAIVDKALDKDGRLMFDTLEDRHLLLTKIDPDVVIRIGNEMLKGLDDDKKDAAGN